MQAFRRKARALGAEYLRPGEVVAVEVAGGVAGLTLADGTTLDAGHVVDAAGPWSKAVAAMAGISLPVEARRRCVFGFEAQPKCPGCPLVIDTSGILVPAGRRGIHHGHRAAAGGRPWRAAADRRPAPLRRADLARTRRARPELRRHPSAQRLGRLLRILDIRSERDHRQAPGSDESAVRDRLQRSRHPARPGGRPGDRRADRPWALHDAGPRDLRLRAPGAGRRVVERNVIG